jgi:hypothetical protein
MNIESRVDNGVSVSAGCQHTFIQLEKGVGTTVVYTHIDFYLLASSLSHGLLGVPLVMKRGASPVITGPTIVIHAVRARLVSSSLPSMSPMGSMSRVVMPRGLSIHSNNDQKKIFASGNSAPEKAPSSNRVNIGASSQTSYSSGSHIVNDEHYTASLAKPKTPRTGPLGRRKTIAEQIHCPDLQATIFVPGTVGPLINLLAIIREAERRYGSIAEYRCPTVVSAALVHSPIGTYFLRLVLLFRASPF